MARNLQERDQFDWKRDFDSLKRSIRKCANPLTSEHINKVKRILNQSLNTNEFAALIHITEWISQDGAEFLADVDISDLFLRLLVRLNDMNQIDHIATCLKQVTDVSEETELDDFAEGCFHMAGVSNDSIYQLYHEELQSRLGKFAYILPNTLSDNLNESETKQAVETLEDIAALANLL